MHLFDRGSAVRTLMEISALWGRLMLFLSDVMVVIIFDLLVKGDQLCF